MTETCPLCPSAPATGEGVSIVGIVTGTPTRPRVQYLGMPVPSPRHASRPQDVEPEEYLRHAAPCAAERCSHFRTERCSLAERLVSVLPPVSSGLPRCGIRYRCMWWQQEGAEACYRCPQVVTRVVSPDPVVADVARTLERQL